MSLMMSVDVDELRPRTIQCSAHIQNLHGLSNTSDGFSAKNNGFFQSQVSSNNLR